jgi:hypothetical protein
VEFQEERKGLGFFFFSKIFKRAIFWVMKGGGDFPPPKGCFLNEMGGFIFSTPLGKGMGHGVFFKGTFSRGCLLGKGVVLFSFFFPFLKGVT